MRLNAGVTPTQYRYTGQYSYTESFGLMYYNARWYDPYLNHFAQPDSIVPGPGNSQAWDRYAYTLNNPLKYIDPSGHDAWWCTTASCSYTYYANIMGVYSKKGELKAIRSHFLYQYVISFVNDTMT